MTNTVRLVIVATLALALCVAAQERPVLHHEIDAMYAPTNEVLPDGRTRVSHSYHYVHPKHQSFVRKQVDGVLATHKYNFVNVDGQAESVTFSPEESDRKSIITINKPSAALRAQLSQSARTAVLTGSSVFDTKGRPLMHHVAERMSEDANTIVARVVTAAYEELFEDLHMEYSTNHMYSAGQNAAALNGAVTPVSGEIRYNPADFSASGRSFRAQRWSWDSVLNFDVFGWVKDKFSSSGILDSVMKTVKQLGADVLDTTRTLLTTGSLHFDRQYDLGIRPYNRQINDKWENVTDKWAVSTGDVQFGASCLFALRLELSMHIERWRFQNTTLNISGGFDGEVTLRANPSLGAKTEEKRLTLYNLQLSPISFRVGAVGVGITFEMPIYGGYAVNGGSERGAIDTTLSSHGKIDMGFTWSRESNGDAEPTPFTPFADPVFAYDARIGGDATGSMAAEMYVEPVIKASVNFIGNGLLTLYAGGQTLVGVDAKGGAATLPPTLWPSRTDPSSRNAAALQSTAAPQSTGCPVNVKVIAQPSVTVYANIDVKAMSFRLMGPQEIGPQVVYKKDIEVLRLCSQLSALGNRYFTPQDVAYTPKTADVGSVYSTVDGQGACQNTKHMSLQVADIGASSLVMFVNVASSRGASFTQQQFNVQRNGQSLRFEHQPSSLDYRSHSKAQLVSAFDGTLSQDGDSIVLKNFAGCPEVTVARSALVTRTATASTHASASGAPVVPIAAAAGAACLVVAAAVASVIVARRRRAAAAVAGGYLEATA